MQVKKALFVPDHNIAVHTVVLFEIYPESQYCHAKRVFRVNVKYKENTGDKKAETGL